MDASKKSVGWARENQALSKLDDKPIRWIVDDALKFVHMQSFWGREPGWPWQGAVTAVSDIATWSRDSPLGTWVILDVIDVTSMFVMLAHGLLRWWKAELANAWTYVVKPRPLAGVESSPTQESSRASIDSRAAR